MNDVAVRLQNISKIYKLYDSPRDRLKEALHPFGKKYHRDYYALKELSLQVNKGEVIGVIGKNGSGKSTLLKLISRILVPNHGTITVEGSVSALIELGAGFNPQFTGRQNIFFYGTILGFTREYMEHRLDAILEFSDIGEYIDQPIKTYSSGMRARLAFAVATEIDSDILIIDEVLSVGDAIFQTKCFARINSLFKNNKTVIFVSHNRNAIVGLCEKAVLLDKGSIRCFGEAKEVIQEYEKICNKKYLATTDKANELKKVSNTHESSAQKIKGETNSVKNQWDSTLESENQIFFKKSNIEFIEFGIYDLDNDKVNVLETGSGYKVKAVFHPGEDINEDITFAIRMKNLQGYVVAWVGYPFAAEEYLSLEKGSKKTIEYVFDNNLLSGVFSIDAGLQSYRDDDLYIHIGIQNVYYFRVEKDVKINRHGVVNLNCRLKDN